MDTDKDIYYIVAYTIILGLLGAFGFGYEAARIVHGMDREMMNEKLQTCNRVISGFSE